MLEASNRSATATAKPSNVVVDEVERLNARLSGITDTLAGLRDRVGGGAPPTSSDAALAETAFNMSGFVGSVGQGLERAHRSLSDIGCIIDQIERVI